MDKHSERICQRGSAWQIMREARRKFYNAFVNKESINGALVALASTHYSLWKRYVEHWWQKPVLAWHIWRATKNVEHVDIFSLSLEQIDICSTIWAKASGWFGGDLERARTAIRYAIEIHPDRDAMKPHTEALLRITLGEIERKQGRRLDAEECFHQAEILIKAVKLEPYSDRDCQLTRILAAVGFFYFDTGKELLTAQSLLIEALALAERVSMDQEEKIRVGLKRRGICLGHARS